MQQDVTIAQSSHHQLVEVTAYIGVLQDPSEGLLQQSCQARVVTGEGFPDEAPLHRGRCRGQALTQQAG